MSTPIRSPLPILLAALAVLLALAFCGTNTGCVGTRYELDTSNVLPAANLVLARVERYAAADATLAAADRHALEDDVRIVRQLLAAPRVDQRVLAGPCRRVCDRHDTWVLSDPSVDALARSVYLETTSNLRRLLEPPG